MKRRIFLPLFLTINAVIFPNDSRTILGSSVEVIDNKDTNIIMREEEINITLHEDYYEVAVIFDFFNSGETETVLLGFPVQTILQDYPDDKEWAKLDDFRSYINGNVIPEYTMREESEKDRSYITTTRWYLREVTFPANEHTFSRVTYKAPYNHVGFSTNAGYIYGTGKNWKGKIGKMTVNISHEDNIFMRYISFYYKKQINYTSEGNGKHKYILEDIEPEISDRIYINIKQFDIYGKYHNELGDEASGWDWDKYLIYRDETLMRPFTKNQVRLFICFFYAFHGYDFENPRYKYYFLKYVNFMDEKWTIYKINPNFSENDFNEFERKNLDYLFRIERMIPAEADIQFAEPFIFNDENIEFEELYIFDDEDILAGENIPLEEPFDLAEENTSFAEPLNLNDESKKSKVIFIPIIAVLTAAICFLLLKWKFKPNKNRQYR